MKTKTTRKEIQNHFSRIIRIGYCDAQTLLNFRSPDWYNAGVYGWNYDAYDLGGGTCIVTGYRPFGNMRIPFEKLRELERKGEEIRYDFGKKYEQQRNEIEALLKEAVSIAEFV